MKNWSSCILLSVCWLASANVSVAQETGRPGSYELTLERALDIARERAPAVLAASERIGEARGQLIQASVLLRDNPVLDAGGGPRRGAARTSRDIELGLGQTFELGGKRSARIDAARAGVEQSVSAADDVTRRILHEVGVSYLRARHVEERLKIAGEIKQLTNEISQVARRKYDAGDVGILDVNLAELVFARFQVEVRNIEAARDRAISDLRVLLGLEPDVEVVIRGNLLDRKRYELVGLLESAPSRPDIMVIDAEIRQAEAEIRLGEARSWPDLGLRFGYMREEYADIYRGSLSLSLPLFDHGQGIEATGKAREASLRIEREAAENSTRARVRSEYKAYQTLIEAVEQFESGIPQLEQTDKLARKSYEAGAIHLGELLSMQREFVQSRVTYADLLLNAALAGIELEAEAGVLR
jgi:outer membrane protein, heavy metal efflux system